MATPTRHPADPRVAHYLAAVADACGPPRGPLVSLVLFGSAATGGYTAPLSDVDLLLIVADDADVAAREHVRETVAALESEHGLGKQRSGRASRLQSFADTITANVRAFFVCSRSDLLSGDPARILGIPRSQAAFVDRVAVPSVVASGMTVWGEHLLDRVPLPPIRRLDVAKAFFGLFNQVLFAAAVYPLLPDATKYAMDALKRSVHNCHFCYAGRTAALADEIARLEERQGAHATLQRLLALRARYAPSFRFVLACLPALMRLHGRTARDVRFPLDPRSITPLPPATVDVRR